MKRIIHQTIIATSIALASHSAFAQIPVTDGAHMGLQGAQWGQNLMQWGKNLQEWYKNYTEWKNSVQRWQSEAKSKLTDAFNNVTGLTDLENTTNPAVNMSALDSSSANSLVSKYKASGEHECAKISDATAKGFCSTELQLKVDKAQKIADTLKQIEKEYNPKLKLALAELDAAVKESNEAANSASDSETGGEASGKLAKVTAKQTEVASVQREIANKYTELAQSLAADDQRIGAIHGMRVDYARMQMSGSQPGMAQQLLSTAAVTTALQIQSTAAAAPAF